MTTMTMPDLTKTYTQQEIDALVDDYVAALENNDDEKADQIGRIIPVLPRWAKIIAKVCGKDFLAENFNITDANATFGEGWLDAQ